MPPNQAGGIVTTLDSGAFVADGAYVYEAQQAATVPQGPRTNVLAIVGAFTDGPVGVPTPISTAGGSGPLLAQFGTGSNVNRAGVAVPFAGLRAALSAMPETNQFVIVRADDGTSAAAAIAIKDGSAGTLATLTFKNPGTEQNYATARLDFQNPGQTGGPFVLTLQPANNVAEVFQGIVGSVTPGGAFDAPTFKASVLAAINTGSSKRAPSFFVTATTGASVLPPQTATVWTGAGGTDGTASINAASLIGTDGISASLRKGMYALRGTQFGGLVLAGNTDPSTAATIAAFLAQTGGLAGVSFPLGTSTAGALSTKAANGGLTASRIIPCVDYDYVNDTLSGNAQLAVDPAPAIMGIICSLPAYQSPSNKPYTGKLGILGTERTRGVPVDPLSEGAQRQQNGIMWLTNQTPGRGQLFGLPHGQAGDGSNICDTRMLDDIAFVLLGILGQFVGEMQTPPPVNGAPDRDLTRNAAGGAIDSYFAGLTNPRRPQVASATRVFTGTPLQVSQGFMPFGITVITLSAVKYALASLQVGNSLAVWVPTTTG